MVKALPVEALTLRLLPNKIGAAIVWLPPLSLILADPVVLASVNVLPLLGLIT
jgi:hypothetical protein